MATVTPEMRVPAAPRRLHPNRWMVLGLVALLAFVGLGTWVLVDRFAGGSDVTALIDETVAAYDVGAEAVVPNYTEDAVLNLFGDVSRGQDEILSYLEGTPLTHVTRTSDVIETGDFAVFFNDWTNTLGYAGTGLSVMQIEDGKIAGHWEFAITVTDPAGTIAAQWPPIELER